MSELAQGLLTQALELPMEDRRWIGERLLESEEVDADAPHHDPEFMAELIRRSDEVHAHPERLLLSWTGAECCNGFEPLSRGRSVRLSRARGHANARSRHH